ncbi:helix-turn-helix domain-containing protein [Nocardioides sp.]|uniref:ArsR/SmtB family transcription factor n=1 Tax=Nocardioides sp. TaxID=35761 RepID=UPI0026160F74|nr:helix-turn-helix domain-containing protein [Nocardioides sp.]
MATYDDPRVLRAIAHPTRNRILAELSAEGTARAADLAQNLDLPANQVSFHLRQLAKYGLVDEAPEAARDRRDRVWQLADPEGGVSFKTREVLAQPGGPAAVEVFRRSASARAHHLVDLAYADPVEGVERIVSESALRLTVDEVAEFNDALQAFVNRWRERAGEPGERETYSLYSVLQPYPDVLHGDGAGGDGAGGDGAEADVPAPSEPFTVRGFGGA